MTRRALISIPVEELAREFGLAADVFVHHVTVDEARDRLLVHVRGDRFDDVPPGVEGRLIDLPAARR